MSKFRWDGEEWELIGNPTFGELEHAERLIKKKFDDWQTIDRSRVMSWLSIRRVDHTRLPWAALTEMSPNDFVDIEEPKPAGAEDEDGTGDGAPDPPKTD